LWRYICVKLPSVTHLPDFSASFGEETYVVDGRKQTSQGNKQICSSPAELRASLLRSGAVPLQVEVYFHAKDGSQVKPFLSAFRIVLGDPVSQRIELLDMAYMWLPDGMVQPDFSIGRFPLVRELRLPDTLQSWNYSLLKSISMTTTRIDTLRLGGGISPELTNCCSFWPLIRTLGLGNSSQFNIISEKLSNLKRLESLLNHWPDQGTPVSTWSKVRDISLFCHPRDLDRVILPNLESLMLTDVRDGFTSDHSMDAYSSISFPKLTRLEVATIDLQWLTKLSLPLLVELVILCSVPACEALPHGANAVFNASTLPAVKTLTLTTLWLDSTLVDVLSSMCDVVTVTLCSSRDRDSKFGVRLLKRLNVERPLICPHLCSLTLGDPDHPVLTPKKDAVPLIKKLVTSQRRRLENVSVCWFQNRTEFENYS